MKYIRYAILALIILLCVTIALANRGPVSLALWPDTVTAFLGFGYTLTLPLFVVVGGAAGLGLMLGLAWEWLRERGIRAEAKANRRELERLRNEHGVKPVSAPTNSARDDVLAIMDEADSAA